MGQQSLYFPSCINPALLKRDSVQSHRYGCNFCSRLIIIASSALLHDAPPARPAQILLCCRKNKRRAYATFDPIFYQPLNPLRERLKRRPAVVTDDGD